MREIRVGIVGVGNAASTLIQSVYYYRGLEDGKPTPGVSFPVLGGYRIDDIRFVSAFDVGEGKVGVDLSEAIFAEPNLVPKFADVPKLNVEVFRGPVLDGVSKHMRKVFKVSDGDSEPTVEEVAERLKETRTEVLVNLLPVGSEEATRFYVEAALKAGVAFVNAIPVFIASSPFWARRFREEGVPVLGDDVKGQIGATVLHRTLVHLLHLRGVLVEETYQLNVGGNTDFLNMTVEERLASKRISKTRAVTSILPYGSKLEEEGRVRVGPSDYVPFLGNTKICYIYVKGRSFADFPVELEVKLKVDDKSMIAGILVDAIRTAKIALERGFKGPVVSASAYLFKHPPIQAESDDEAYTWFKRFVEQGEDVEPIEAEVRVHTRRLQAWNIVSGKQ